MFEIRIIRGQKRELLWQKVRDGNYSSKIAKLVSYLVAENSIQNVCIYIKEHSIFDVNKRLKRALQVSEGPSVKGVDRLSMCNVSITMAEHLLVTV